MKKERLRQRYIFWLNLNKQTDSELAAHIAELKAGRKFVRTIRDGLRLIQDLQAGHLAVLLALFPWVAEQLQSPLYSDELTDLLEHFRQVARERQLAGSDFPPPNPSAMSEVKAVFNESAAIQQSVLNTLAALEEL